MRGICALLACSALVACAPEAPPEEEVPAVRGLVLVVIDTLRADGGAGLAGPVATPRMDELAADGASFSQAFSHAPITLPAHAALFSGRPAHETGVWTNGQEVPEQLPLLAEHLARQGWRTGAVVSLGSLSTAGAPGWGIGRGFELFERAGAGFAVQGEAVRQRVIEVLERLQGPDPFFLFAHFSDPHEPYNDRREAPRTAEVRLDGDALTTVETSVMTLWETELELEPGIHRLEIRGEQELRLRILKLKLAGSVVELEFETGQMKAPGREFVARFEVPAGAPPLDLRLWITDAPARAEIPGRYASEVEYADAQVGALLDELRSRGLYDDCAIVLTSDHGESLGERRFIGHVRSLHDELLRVPLIIKPARGDLRRERLRARSSELVALADVAPTVLELLRLPPLPGQQGFSLLAAERREFLVAETVLTESMTDDQAVDLLALRDERWKLVYFVDEDRFALLDLERDPAERDADELSTALAPDGWAAVLRALAAGGAPATEAELGVQAREALEALGYLGDE